ncbi:GNAT family N-acetyltransferase [Streptomyces antimycoticus]|uniref:N-acetyltransferase domain-containing protein n=1 Tax=Streptomyces mordarskii TaxID=1226758 RepID=A0ABP3NGQ0_9ACTN
MPSNTDDRVHGVDCSAAFRVTRLERYGAAELRTIVGDDADPSGVSGLGLTWRPKEHHFGLQQEDRLVAHAGWVTVPVSIGDSRFPVAGLGGVVVSPKLRGQGLAQLVVEAAMAHARHDGLRFGLLFCLPDRVPLYRRLGWNPLVHKISIEQPEEIITMPLPGMWKSLYNDARWPQGPVRLLSLPM